MRMTNMPDLTKMNPRDITTLRAIMEALRTPVTGCPWDLEQNFSTIAPYTIEEAYEVADAIQRGLADRVETDRACIARVFDTHALPVGTGSGRKAQAARGAMARAGAARALARL